MSVIKISELVEVAELNLTDTFPVVSNGATRKANVQQILDIVNKNVSLLNVLVVSSIEDVTQPNIIYLVPNSSGENNNYDEYMLINELPEKIGSTSVDLSNYSTTTEVQSMINNAIGGALDGSY